MNKALGLIEAIGFATATAALDAASKAAEVTLVGIDKVIGVEGLVGVNIQIAGEVAAVQAAVDAGVEEGNRVGRIFTSKVIPRPHDEVDKLTKQFAKNLKEQKKIETAKTENKKTEDKKKK